MHTTPLAVLALLISVQVSAQRNGQRLSLWPNGAPGSEARRNEPEQAKDY